MQETVSHSIQKLMWIKDKNVRAKSTRLLEGKVGVNLYDPGLGTGVSKM